jgi:DNA-binding transcriptional LysR family regulator
MAADLGRSQGRCSRSPAQAAFREAARASGSSASSLSEAVRRLEAQLGVRLLHRTTRSVAPTEAGARLLDRLEPALVEVEAALDVVNGFRDKSRGHAAAQRAGQRRAAGVAAHRAAFLAAYPDILLDIVAEDSFVDVLASGCDAGIRYDERLEQDMVAVPIGPRDPALRHRRRARLPGPPRPPRASARPARPRLPARPVRERCDAGVGVRARWRGGEGRADRAADRAASARPPILRSMPPWPARASSICSRIGCGP